ncbi:hypothetical protein [Inhella sp.]|uniref:hypothetical protein n=1 Tax=Inhella sp. TaxID=1921806 RepID=UPI0035B00EC4
MVEHDPHAPGQFFSVGTVHAPRVRLALEHNLRHTLQGHQARQGVNPLLTSLNVVIGGQATVEAAMQAIGDELARVGMTGFPARANGAAMTEVLVSAPPGLADADDYLRESLRVVCMVLDAPLIQATIHHDQGRPHFHALLLPIKAGRWVGSRLHDLAAVKRLRVRMAETVGVRFGVKSETRYSGERLRLAIEMLDRWFEQHSPGFECPTYPATRAAYCKDPRPFLKLARLEVPERSFTAIMTSAGAATAEDRRQGRSSGAGKVLKQKVLHRKALCPPDKPLKQFASPESAPSPAESTLTAAQLAWRAKLARREERRRIRVVGGAA